MKVTSRWIMCLVSLSIAPVAAKAALPEGTPRAPAREGKLVAGTSTTTVELNTADAEQLTRLPGIGKGRAAVIIARRAKRPFRAPQELAALKGIGPKLFRKIRPLVRVDPAPSPSSADRARADRTRANRAPAAPAAPEPPALGILDSATRQRGVEHATTPQSIQSPASMP